VSRDNRDKYSMQIIWSDEDQAYIVTVPELPGCVPVKRLFRRARRPSRVELRRAAPWAILSLLLVS